MQIEDDGGRRWLVQGGDPAAKHVNALKRRGFEYVVLPTETLVHGELVPTFPTGEPADASASGEIVRQVRLLDCLDVLKETA